jgi:hypothetical protein
VYRKGRTLHSLRVQRKGASPVQKKAKKALKKAKNLEATRNLRVRRIC